MNTYMYYFIMRAVWVKLLENPNCLNGLKEPANVTLKTPVGLLIILTIVSNTELPLYIITSA